jgi:hypothetical protein
VNHILEDDEQFVIVDPKVFKTVLAMNLVLPLFEDEDGENIYGYGRWEPHTFAAIANVYDRALTGGEYRKHRAKDVRTGLFLAWKRIDELEEDYFRFEKMDEPSSQYDLSNSHYFYMTYLEHQ